MSRGALRPFGVLDMRNRLRGKRHEVGFTVIELSIVIAIIGAMGMMIAPALYRAMSEAKVDDFSGRLVASANRLNDYAQVLGTFQNMTVTQAIAHDLLDPSLVASDSSAVNAWGYAVTLTPGYISSASYYNSLGISFSVPRAVCGSLVAELESHFYKVTVAGTTVKSAPDGDRAVNGPTTATACSSSTGTVALVFYTSL